MPKSTNWVWATVIGVGSVLTVTTPSKGRDEPRPAIAPAPKEVPPNEAWFPKKIEYQKGQNSIIGATVPSAFPDLSLPKWDRTDPNAEEKVWPRLTGKIALKIEPTDAVQKILKSRLYQGVSEFRRYHSVTGVYRRPPFAEIFDCMEDIQATAIVLWAGQPKELIPWLEELIVAAKIEEMHARLRAEAGAFIPQHLHYAIRHRLKTETALWKVKNVNARHDESPPAKQDDAKAKPSEGEWLADKKRPPSLFPDIVLPPRAKNDPDGKLRQAQFAKLCPRLHGSTGLKIEAGDSTLQKLLKARLHQGALEIQALLVDKAQQGFWTHDPAHRSDCLDDMLTVLVELWEKEPKQLVPWLEELLIEAKEFERFAQLRAEAGAIRPSELNQATRQRLKVESELWKAKNAK